MSFVKYTAECQFPIQNLPYGVFRRSVDSPKHIGVAIGDQIVDLAVLVEAGLFADDPTGRNGSYLACDSLNEFMAQGRTVWKYVRQTLTRLLDANEPRLRDDTKLCSAAFVAQSAAIMEMPANIGDYTDFYSSREHATNLGVMMRGADNALQPNWLHLPVGYHGRSSSIVVSGTPFPRPCGQLKPDDGAPEWGTCKLLDFELEVAFLVGPGNKLGTRIGVEQAEEHIFGLVLLNDWFVFVFF